MNEEQPTNETSEELISDQDNEQPYTDPTPDNEEPENKNPSDGDEQPADDGAPSDDSPADPPAPEATTPTDTGDDDDYGKRLLASASQVDMPELDLSKLKADENGLVDVEAFGQTLDQTLKQREEAMMARVTNHQRALDTEREAWNDAQDKYPELRKDRELQDDIQAYRIGVFQTHGKLMSPMQAANRYMKRFSQAQEKGFETARRNTQVQNSAHADAGSRRPTGDTELARLNEKARSSNRQEQEAAMHELLKGSLFSD